MVISQNLLLLLILQNRNLDLKLYNIQRKACSTFGDLYEDNQKQDIKRGGPRWIRHKASTNQYENTTGYECNYLDIRWQEICDQTSNRWKHTYNYLESELQPGTVCGFNKTLSLHCAGTVVREACLPTELLWINVGKSCCSWLTYWSGFFQEDCLIHSPEKLYTATRRMVLWIRGKVLSASCLPPPAGATDSIPSFCISLFVDFFVWSSSTVQKTVANYQTYNFLSISQTANNSWSWFQRPLADLILTLFFWNEMQLWLMGSECTFITQIPFFFKKK